MLVLRTLKGILNIGAAIAAGFIFLPAAAQTPSAGKPKFEAWKSCVTAKAIRYSKASDSAEAVVNVALLACKPERTKFWDQMSAEGIELGVQLKVIEQIEKTLKEDTTIFVMEKRLNN